MIKLIHRVKRQSPVPVTTGEIWNVWMDHPELVAAVDFIAVHILRIGRAARRAGGRPSNQDLRQAARRLSRQAHRDRRVRLAERRLQFSRRRPGRTDQPGDARLRQSARINTASTTTSSKRSINRGKRTKAASARTRECLTPRFNAKFPWPVNRSPIPSIGSLAGHRASARSPPVAADPRHDRGQRDTGGDARGARRCRRLVAANMFAFWTGHYFVPGAAFAFTASA